LEENLSEGEIEEFGIGKTLKVVKTSPVEIKLVSKSKLQFENRKGMGLYADELGEHKAKRFNTEDLGRKNQKKSRYQPYTLNTKTVIRNNSLADRLSGLRPDVDREPRRVDMLRIERVVETERDNRKLIDRNRKHSNFSRQRFYDDDEDSGSPPARSDLKSTVHSVVNNSDDLRNRLNLFK